MGDGATCHYCRRNPCECPEEPIRCRKCVELVAYARELREALAKLLYKFNGQWYVVTTPEHIIDSAAKALALTPPNTERRTRSGVSKRSPAVPEITAKCGEKSASWQWPERDYTKWITAGHLQDGWRIDVVGYPMTADEAAMLAEALQQAVAWVREQGGSVPSESPTIEEQIKQLKAAGWICVRRNLWKAPTGGYFIGPHQAWVAMNRREGQELPHA